MIENFKQLLISIVGEYISDLTAEGLAQVDWVWIASAVLFIGLVFIFFKAIRFLLSLGGKK